MRRPRAAALLLVLAGACADSGTPVDPERTKAGSVEVSVETRDGAVHRVIRNGRARTVLYHVRCSVDLERAEGETWTRVPGLPDGHALLCPLILLPPIRIGAGETRVDVWTDPEDWEPGEYRFNLPLFDEGGRRLPERERRSGSFVVPWWS